MRSTDSSKYTVLILMLYQLTNGSRHFLTAPNCPKYSFISSEKQISIFPCFTPTFDSTDNILHLGLV